LKVSVKTTSIGSSPPVTVTDNAYSMVPPAPTSTPEAGSEDLLVATETMGSSSVAVLLLGSGSVTPAGGEIEAVLMAFCASAGVPNAKANQTDRISHAGRTRLALKTTALRNTLNPRNLNPRNLLAQAFPHRIANLKAKNMPAIKSRISNATHVKNANVLLKNLHPKQSKSDV